MSFAVFPMPALPDGRQPVVTSSFGPRSGRMHKGSDILYRRKDEPLKLPWSAPSGRFAVPDSSIGLAVPALAAADGVVSRSSWIRTGDRVRIDHGGGLSSAYMHLRKRRVKVGDRVKAGQPIGTISFGPSPRQGPAALPPPSKPLQIALNHLHFEAYRNGVAVDPEPLLKRARVLPFPEGDSKWLLAALVAVGLGVYASRFIR